MGRHLRSEIFALSARLVDFAPQRRCRPSARRDRCGNGTALCTLRPDAFHDPRRFRSEFAAAAARVELEAPADSHGIGNSERDAVGWLAKGPADAWTDFFAARRHGN